MFILYCGLIFLTLSLGTDDHFPILLPSDFWEKRKYEKRERQGLYLPRSITENVTKPIYDAMPLATDNLLIF